VKLSKKSQGNSSTRLKMEDPFKRRINISLWGRALLENGRPWLFSQVKFHLEHTIQIHKYMFGRSLLDH
jgi:hypothetical protein